MVAKKVVIHEFNPIIYPFKLWVVCSDKYDVLNERFYRGDNLENLNRDVFETHEAITFLVKERGVCGPFGALVAFTERRYFTVKNMAHEASHVADYLFEHIRELTPGDEPKAYLIGWIVDCMNQVKTNKFKE